MMAARIIIEKGDTFGNLTIVCEIAPRKYKTTNGRYWGNRRMVMATCKCCEGDESAPEYPYMLQHLISGNTKSCGCIQGTTRKPKTVKSARATVADKSIKKKAWHRPALAYG